MTHLGRSCVGGRTAPAVVLAFLLLGLGATAAGAQIGDDLVPDLPTSEALPSPLQTPIDDLLPGDGRDAPLEVGETIDALLGDGSEPEPAGGDGSGSTERTDTAETTDTGDGDPSGGDRKTERSSPATVAEPSDPQPVPVTGAGAVYGRARDLAYPASAGRAAIVAAGRALRLAGPLAPPLALAAVAIASLIATSRGSERLVKDHAPPGRSFRL